MKDAVREKGILKDIYNLIDTPIYIQTQSGEKMASF